eukprot:2111169-Prymnesium_polylepis.1
MYQAHGEITCRALDCLSNLGRKPILENTGRAGARQRGSGNFTRPHFRLSEGPSDALSHTRTLRICIARRETCGQDRHFPKQHP